MFVQFDVIFFVHIAVVCFRFHPPTTLARSGKGETIASTKQIAYACKSLFNIVALKISENPIFIDVGESELGYEFC